MLPLQILTQNLLYDISQSSIPWDTMDKDFLEKPKKWDAGSIKKFMLYIYPLSSIFDYITFAVMFFIFKANAPEHQSLFQTGWFVEGLLSQTLIVHIIRTKNTFYSELGSSSCSCTYKSDYAYWDFHSVYSDSRISENAAATIILFPLPSGDSYRILYSDSVCKTMVYPEIPAMVIK